MSGENSEPGEPPAEPQPTGKAKELVFVLRLRAGKDGWWGLVRKGGEPAPFYIRNTSQLLELLDNYWHDAPTHGRPEQPEKP